MQSVEHNHSVAELAKKAASTNECDAGTKPLPAASATEAAEAAGSKAQSVCSAWTAEKILRKRIEAVSE